MSDKIILIWFRNDLRIHDNEILIEAVKRAEKVIPVYCFDPRYFTETKFGTKRTGLFRARFLLESVTALRRSLRELGGDLVIRTGKPEDVFPEICSRYKVREVYHHREVAPEETAISALVEKVLWKQQINLKHFIGHTLYHKEDLPFPIKNIPNNFSAFRKKVERESAVRPCFEAPDHITIPEDMKTGELPSLEDLKVGVMPGHELLEFNFKGGEKEGLLYLKKLLETKITKGRKSQVPSPLKLSPWLSNGCISPREVYREVSKFKKQQPELCAKIISDLQWRDYFRFMIKKHGSIMPEERDDLILSGRKKKRFEEWKSGTTGEGVVDACMHQLNATGYISDVCRQYTASYLVNDLGVSWTAGAAYFEEKVIDYSPASNLGGWASVLRHGVISSNRPLTIQYNKVAEEEDIKRWLSEFTNTNLSAEQ